jgi:SAM-dependent methyltransferase
MADRIDFDKYTEQYNRLLQEGTAFFSKNDAYFAKYKVDLMKSRLSRPVKRLLEYGCGIGRNIPFLKESFPEAEVVGVDISRASLEVARQNQPDIKFIHESENASDLGLFDLIFVACVFHHVPIVERRCLSDKLYRHLRTPGDLFVFEHNPYNPVTRRIVSKCVYDEDAVLLTPRELRGYLNTVGFKSSHTAYCLFFPPSFESLARLECKLGWLPLGGQYFVHVSK